MIQARIRSRSRSASRRRCSPIWTSSKACARRTRKTGRTFSSGPHSASIRPMRAAALAFLALIGLASSGSGTAKAPVEVEMRNVDLHLTSDIGVHIRHLRGRFIAEGNRTIPNLDDPRSYSVTIDDGEVAVDLASLNAMMTRTLQGHSNVSRLEISVDDEGRLRQKGVVKKGIPVPFDVRART